MAKPLVHLAKLNYFARCVAVKKQKAPAPDDVPFEEGLKKLEAIVEEMEGDDMPLENLLKHYEEGVRLAKGCQEKLDFAELKIKKLQPNADGEDELVDEDSIEF